MRSAKFVVFILALVLLAGVLAAEADRGSLQMKTREAGSDWHSGVPAKGDTIWYSGFEAGDPLGVNVDYNAKSSPDMWHVTRHMLYQGTASWMYASVDTYFCHIGCDTMGYQDGNEVGYQIYTDLTGYGSADLYYLSAMQAYDVDAFDKFVVWGQYEEMGSSWLNLDPGEGSAWGGDWGMYWYEPEFGLVSLDDLAGHSGVIIEFWFLSDSGHPEGFGVAIDEIIITGTPSTAVEGVSSGTPLPGDFRLDPAYPNPFNARVTFNYQVPEADVHIGIYNVSGQLVRVLANGSMDAGVHLLTWDSQDDRGEDVSSGVYFCQLRSSGVTLTRKIVLLR
ncbi:T9SS type A sorting domain-containing protein [Candidatus Zixiibacteriota bacterium]